MPAQSRAVRHSLSSLSTVSDGGTAHQVPSVALFAAMQFGSTPLHNAIEKGHTEVVTTLLAAGADVNAKGYVSAVGAWYEGGDAHVKASRNIGTGCMPVSYTHLTLPTNREV